MNWGKTWNNKPHSFAYRRRSFSGISFFIIVLLISCNRIGEDQGKSVFRYNEAAGITSLDPAYAKDLANIWPCHQLFNGLVQNGDNLQIEPSIARSWSIDSGGTIYTFHLRNDVYFHDHPVFPGGKGRKVIASDFVYSFSRIMDPLVTSPGAWIFNQVARTDEGFAFSALNDSTFEIRLSAPFHPFLGILAMQYGAVVPHEIVRHYGAEFRRNPVGTGPFRFKLWKEGVKLVLLKNERYFEYEEGRRLPYLDAIAVTFLADKQSAFLEFIKGNLDFMSGLDASYKDELLTRTGELRDKYRDRFRLVTLPYLNTEYLGILVDNGIADGRESPLRSKEFRQAIQHGFDRRKMIYYLRNNIGSPGMQGIIPPGMMAFDSSWTAYPYDPAKARQLLKEAGYGPGREIPEISLHATADYLDIFKYIQHQLGEIGINMRIEVEPAATLKELRAQSKVDFFRASWIADYPDEENYLSLFVSHNFSPSGPNYTHFSNPEFDGLYQQALTTTNDTIRKLIYRRMDRMVMEESPVIILYYDQVLRFTSKDIQNMGINPLNLLILKKVEKTSTVNF